MKKRFKKHKKTFKKLLVLFQMMMFGFELQKSESRSCIFLFYFTRLVVHLKIKKCVSHFSFYFFIQNFQTYYNFQYI